MIVHRDYMSSSDSMIRIFDDRIEFFNPGCLMAGLSIEQLVRGNYVSAIRNKQIATLFWEKVKIPSRTIWPRSNLKTGWNESGATATVIGE